jgi:hypothetical protein
MAPTIAPTTSSDDSLNIEQSHTLVLGVMGVGTFLLVFFLVLLSLVWFLSYSCAPTIKSVWRAVSTSMFLITFLVLLYAPRNNRYENNNLEPPVSAL